MSWGAASNVNSEKWVELQKAQNRNIHVEISKSLARAGGQGIIG